MSIQSSGKTRVVLDLREVNIHLWKKSVKYDDMRTALLYIEKHGWLIKFDIHSAYHHIDVYPPHTQYLVFSWVIDSKKVFFRFLVLPFGLSTAPHCFTNLSMPLIAKWRGEGLHILMYLDDGLCHNIDRLELIGQSGRSVHVRTVAKFVGQIMSMSIVLGNITQLMTRCISMYTLQARSCNDRVVLNDDCVIQMRFWLNHLSCINFRELRYTPQCNRTVYSDASST